MTNTKHDPHRLELVQSGKLEERRSPRSSIIPAQEEAKIEDAGDGFKLTPEMIAIALMVMLLLALTVIGF